MMKAQAVVVAALGLAVVVCVVTVLVAHATVGWANLGVMLLGLAGLLAVLYAYNRRHR